MESIQESFNRVDTRITSFLAKYAITILRVSLGINFLWFGALKLIPGLSPAEGLATNTRNTTRGCGLCGNGNTTWQ